MKLLEKILLATDFSKSSENLLEYAIALAKIFHSQIILVHVLPDDIANEKARLLLSQAALKQLEDIKNKIKSVGLIAGEPILEFGSPFDKIIQAADNVNANVTLIGSGEKSKNDVFQLGITAYKIIRKSNKPVWVVKQGKILNIKNIICPIDFSPESERALKNAIIIARRFNTELLILSVCKTYYSRSSRIEVDWDKENEKAHLEHVKKFNLYLQNFNLTDLDWDRVIASGDPATEILGTISRYKSDLVIMGTTGKSSLSRLMLGSVTEKIIRDVPCSLITLKKEDIIELQLEPKIFEIENHYGTALKLIKEGHLKESITEFKLCLNINEMHIPSLKGIADVYEKLGDKEIAKEYRKIASDILVRIWDKNIEGEIRKFYKL
ncbi:universal stress protein [Draconibacterium sp.]|nr:universal stress protein [Draconibacterium sp.]